MRLRASIDCLTSIRKPQRSTEITCFVRSYLANEIRLEISSGYVEAAPKMNTEISQQMLAQSRARSSHFPYLSEPPPTSSSISITPVAAGEAPPPDPAGE